MDEQSREGDGFAGRERHQLGPLGVRFVEDGVDRRLPVLEQTALVGAGDDE